MQTRYHLTSLVVLSCLLLVSLAVADDVEWVGYQNGCGGDNNPGVGSFFHGDNWLGFVPPGPGDRALFGTEFDTPPTGYPNTVHFGNFCFQAGVCSAVQIPGGTITFQDFIIRDDAWVFDFTEGSSGCAPAPGGPGSFDLTGGWDIGTNPSQAAQVTVLNGSMTTDRLNVGLFGGEGYLTLEGGSQTEVGGQFQIGVETLGVLSVTGSGTSLEKVLCCDSGFGIGAGGNGSLYVSSGATVTLGAGNHHVGRGGDARGRIVVSSAAACSTSQTWILGSEGDTPSGVVEVTGTGSRLSAAGGFEVGKFATSSAAGSLLVRNGAEAAANYLSIAIFDTGIGCVEISGGGTLDINDGVRVGECGTAAMSISSGGSLETGFGLWIGKVDGSAGDMTIQDAGSQAVVDGGVFIGDQSQGSLVISGGGSLTAQTGRIGANTIGNGQVTVTGVGSLFEPTQFLDVGLEGTGALNVFDQSQVVTTGTIRIGGNGTGSLDLDNAAIDAPLVIMGTGSSVRAVGELTGSLLTEAGVVDSMAATIGGTWDIGGNSALPPVDINLSGGSVSCDRFSVGLSGGTGSATLANGAQVTVDSEFRVGFFGTGELVLTGDGTTLSKTGCCDAFVGSGAGAEGILRLADQALLTISDGGNDVGRDGGRGLLSISGAAACSTGQLWIVGSGGDSPSGTIDVAGVGSRFVTTDGMQIAREANSAAVGSLLVRTGAEARAAYLSMAVFPSGVSHAEISGGGSVVIDAGGVRVGEQGVGTMVIAGGGSLDTGFGLWVGQLASSNGTLTIEDSGSQATVDGGVFVGDSGQGSLDITGGGVLAAINGEIGFSPLGKGEANVTGAGSILNISNVCNVGLQGTGNLTVGAGGVVTAGAVIGAGGAGVGEITLAGGTLDAPTIEIREGGCLQGDGTILGNVISTGGKIRPGDSVDPYGDLDVDGDLEFTPESKPAEFDAAGPLPSDDRDKVNVTGTARLNGTLVLNLRDGYVPAAGDTLNLIDYGSLGATLRGSSDFECFAGLDVGDSLSFTPLANATQYLLIAGAASGNQAPSAQPDSASTPADIPLTLDLVANDSDPDFDGLRIYDVDVTGTAGTVAIDGDFTVTYTPDPAMLGTDTFSYRVTDCLGGSSTATVTIEVGLATTSIPYGQPQGGGTSVATSHRVLRVAPNPFSGATQIRWSQTTSEKVAIAVYNVRGERVTRLVQGEYAAGEHEVTWRGKDEGGDLVPAGVYFVRYAAGATAQAERIVLLR